MNVRLIELLRHLPDQLFQVGHSFCLLYPGANLRQDGRPGRLIHLHEQIPRCGQARGSIVRYPIIDTEIGITPSGVHVPIPRQQPVQIHPCFCNSQQGFSAGYANLLLVFADHADVDPSFGRELLLG